MPSSALVQAIDRAHALLDEGRADRARAILERALGGEAGDAVGDAALDRAQALGLLAVALRDLEDLAGARSRFGEARALLAPRHDPDARRALGALLEDLAELELELRHPDTARALLREAIAAEESAGDRIEAETWLALAEAELACDGCAAALDAARRAAEDADRAGDRENGALARELAADAHAAAGAEDEARAGYDDVLARWRALGEPEGAARAIVALARLDERADDVEALRGRMAALAAVQGLDPEARAEAEAEVRDLLVSAGAS